MIFIQTLFKFHRKCIGNGWENLFTDVIVQIRVEAPTFLKRNDEDKSRIKEIRNHSR